MDWPSRGDSSFRPRRGDSTFFLHRRQCSPIRSAKAVTLYLKRFPVTPDTDYDLNVPLSVSGNGERAGCVALQYVDGAGKGVRRDRV